jgi:DNA-binding GntR family transcriptional regulator
VHALRKSYSDNELAELVDHIKQDIIFGRLRPRERLIEDDLSTRFGASRHLIRSAFSDLEKLGLVTRRPNKGAIVRDFSPREVEEMYEMRALLQAEAIRRIPLPADRALIDQLEAIHDQYCEAVDGHDLKRVCTLNNEFHHTMFSACNNGYLAGMIQRVWVETLGIRCYAIGDPVLLVRSRSEHRKMLDALKAGERNKLVQLCVEHIWPALQAYKRAHGGWPTDLESAA